jgi:integrase
MAVIEKRGPLQWRARVRSGGIATSKTFMTKEDAKRWGLETELAISRGIWQDLSTLEQSWPELAGRYLEEVTPLKKSSVAERSRIKMLLEAPELQRPIGQLQAVHIAGLRDRRLAEIIPKGLPHGGKKRSPQSVLHEINTISAILEHAKKEWSIPLAGNPARDIRKPRGGQARDRRISREEQHWIESACALADSSVRVGGPSHLRAAFVLAIETSMRLGELLALHWPDIDLARKILYVRDSKNGRPRTVALSPRAREILGELKAAGKPVRLVQAGGDGATEPQPRPAVRRALARAAKAGKVLHWARSDSFHKTWVRALARARVMYEDDCQARGVEPDPKVLKGVVFHSTRHEAVSRLFEAQLGVMAVASMSGHASLQVLKRYTHTDSERLAAQLEAALGRCAG